MSYTPEEAIAIVTSVSPGSSRTMQDAVAAAPDTIEHLRRLGYELRPVDTRPPRMAASMIGEGTVLHQDGRL
jgi:hypothetical protein